MDGRKIAGLTAVLAAVLSVGPVSGQGVTLSGSSYTIPIGTNPGTITLNGSNFSGRPAVSLMLPSTVVGPNQQTFTVDPSDVVATSSTTLVVSLPPEFFAKYSYFRLNGISQLRPGDYTVQVANPGTAPATEVVHVPLVQIQPGGGTPGVQMISSPFSFDQDFAHLGFRTAIWQPQANNGQGGYLYSPNAPADMFHAGQGFWALFNGPINIDGPPAASPPTTPVSVPLQAGWNQVGDPFDSTIFLSQISFQDASGTTDFAAALSARKVSPFYAYDSHNGTYVTLLDPTQSLHPWDGEWIYAAAPGTLVFTPPAAKQFTVRGTVVGSDTGLPVSGRVLGLPGGVKVFRDGGFTVDGVPNGFYTITASSTGYMSQITAARVMDGDVTLPRIRLEPAPAGATRSPTKLTRATAVRSRDTTGAPVINGAAFGEGETPDGQLYAYIEIQGSGFATDSLVLTVTLPDSLGGKSIPLDLTQPGGVADPASPTQLYNTGIILDLTPGILAQLGITGVTAGTYPLQVTNPDGSSSNTYDLVATGTIGGTTGGGTTGGGTTGGGTTGGNPTGPSLTSATYNPPTAGQPAAIVLQGSGFTSNSVVEVASAPDSQDVLASLPAFVAVVTSPSSITITVPTGTNGQLDLSGLPIPMGLSTIYFRINDGGQLSAFVAFNIPATTVGGAAPVITNASYSRNDPYGAGTSSTILLVGANLGVLVNGNASGPAEAFLAQIGPNGQPENPQALYTGNFTPADNTLTTLTVYLPQPLDPGTYVMLVINPDGSYSNLSPQFAVPEVTSPYVIPPPGATVSNRYVALAGDLGQNVPMLTSATYDGAFYVTLSGTNLQEGLTVTITQPDQQQFTVLLGADLVAAVPHKLTEAGDYLVQVQSSTGQESLPSNQVSFNVASGAPVLLDATYYPNGAPFPLNLNIAKANNPSIQMDVDNFYQGGSNPLTVIIDGVGNFVPSSQTIVDNQSGQITVILDSPLNPGSYGCSVENPNGQLSAKVQAQVTSSPVHISQVFYHRVVNGAEWQAAQSIGVPYGPWLDGSTLVIQGTGFQPGAIVRVDGDTSLEYAGAISADGTLIAASNGHYLSTTADHWVGVYNSDGGYAELHFSVNGTPDLLNTAAAVSNGLNLFGGQNNPDGVGDSFQVFNTQLGFGGPAAPAVLLFDSSGKLVAAGGGNVVSNDGGTLLSPNGSPLLSPGSNLIGQDVSNVVGSALLSENGLGLLPLPPEVLSGVVSHDGGSIILNGGGNIILNGGGNIILNGGGNLISQDGAGIILNGGGNIILNGGGNVIGINGGNFTGLGDILGSSIFADAGATLVGPSSGT